jgi:hypothetical protein
MSAAGKALNPGIIFKGKDLQAQWFHDSIRKLAPWHLICSEKGWTDNTIAVSWLEEVFLPQAQELRNNDDEACLLILDGHGSHTSVSIVSP